MDCHTEQTGDQEMSEEELYRNLEEKFPDCRMLFLQISGIEMPEPEEWQALVDATGRGDIFARERVVQMYLRIIIRQAYFFSETYYCDFEDAFQDGVLGLLDAVVNYKVTPPKDYAQSFQFWVTKAMQRYRWPNGSIMRYPVDYEGCVLPYQELSDIIFEESLDEEHNDDLLNGGREPVYEQDMEAAIVRQELSRTVRDALLKLDDRQRGIIEYRFGFRDGRRYTLKEVGKIYNLSKERVRQIEARAIARLRTPSQMDRLSDFLS